MLYLFSLSSPHPEGPGQDGKGALLKMGHYRNSRDWEDWQPLTSTTGALAYSMTDLKYISNRLLCFAHWLFLW